MVHDDNEVMKQSEKYTYRGREYFPLVMGYIFDIRG